MIETRTARRLVPRKTATTLITASGKSLSARIINLSEQGVAVEVNLSKLGSDEIVKVGTHPVKQGRKIALGAVFQFVSPLDPKSCNRDVVL